MTAKTNRRQFRTRMLGKAKTIWLAPTHAWEISKGTDGLTLTDWRCEGGHYGTSYRIDARFIDQARHMLTLAKTHEIPTPAYVCRAILDHCA